MQPTPNTEEFNQNQYMIWWKFRKTWNNSKSYPQTFNPIKRSGRIQYGIASQSLISHGFEAIIRSNVYQDQLDPASQQLKNHVETW